MAATTAAAIAVSATAILFGLTQHVLIRSDAATAVRLNPLSSEALSEEAASALIKGDQARAEALAHAAIRTTPLTPLAFSTLAFVRKAQGRDREVATLMATAARLSWANEAAQLWMIGRAFDEDRFDEAVIRSDALLRQRRIREAMFSFLRGLSTEPAALDAIAERLAAEPRWRQDFLTQLAELSPETYAGHEQLLLRLKRSAAPPTRDEVNAYVWRLVRDQRYTDARAAWTRLNDRGANSGSVGDGSFERLGTSERPSPFEWTVTPVPGLSLRAPPRSASGGTEGLHIAAEGRPSGRALEQVVILAPGTYHLATEAREAKERSLQSLRWEMTCLGGSGRVEIQSGASPKPDRSWQRIDQVVRIPPLACPAQRLELRIDHDAASDLDAAVRSIAIRKLS